LGNLWNLNNDTVNKPEVINEELVKFLKVYSAYDQDGPLQLVRHGSQNDGGYVVPVKAFKSADVLLGYGIATDNFFEDSFSQIYNKPSYGFDCGIDHIHSKSPLFTFVSQCIGSDRWLYGGQKSSRKISSFSQQIDNLGLKNKKVFVKVDIEGAEYDAFESILEHYANITGIVLEIHFSKTEANIRVLKLLNDLDKHFVLLHVHGNNCCLDSWISTTNSIGKIPTVIELTYINKALVTKYHLAENQAHPTAIDMPNILNKPDTQFEVLL